MQTNLDDWDIWLVSYARFISTKSKDPSTAVGCVLIDNRHRTLGTGYNGFPAGVLDTEQRLNDRETKLSLTQPAERNAIAFSTKTLDGSTAYVWPIPPCAPCAGALIQVGVKRVVAPELPPTHKRWQRDYALSLEMYQESGVVLDLAPRIQTKQPTTELLLAYDKLAEAERAFRSLAKKGDTIHHRQLQQRAEKLLKLQTDWAL